jgi:hypothetical protein
MGKRQECREWRVGGGTGLGILAVLVHFPIFPIKKTSFTAGLSDLYA